MGEVGGTKSHLAQTRWQLSLVFDAMNSKSQRQLESKAIAIIGKSSYFCTEFCGRYRFDSEDVTAVY